MPNEKERAWIKNSEEKFSEKKKGMAKRAILKVLLNFGDVLGEEDILDTWKTYRLQQEKKNNLPIYKKIRPKPCQSNKKIAHK